MDLRVQIQNTIYIRLSLASATAFYLFPYSFLLAPPYKPNLTPSFSIYSSHFFYFFFLLFYLYFLNFLWVEVDGFWWVHSVFAIFVLLFGVVVQFLLQLGFATNVVFCCVTCPFFCCRGFHFLCFLGCCTRCLLKCFDVCLLSSWLLTLSYAF